MIEGEYVTYLPQKMVLKPSNAYYDNATQDLSPKGLYQSLVAEHMKLDFFHHYSTTSYAIISNLANPPDSPDFDSNSHKFIAQQLQKLTILSTPKLLCGWNLSELAQISAVGFVIYLVGYVVFKLSGTGIRICILKSETKFSTAVMDRIATKANLDNLVALRLNLERGNQENSK